MGMRTDDEPDHLTTPADLLEGTFPGRRLAGVTMVAAPLLLFAGSLLLSSIYDAGGTELITNIDHHRSQGLLGLNAATAGTVLAALAVAGLATMIARRRPRIGRAGGALTLLGLFGPGFFLGVYFAAAHMNTIPARAAAGHALDDTQSTFHVINLTGPCLVVGLILLAVGAHRAGVLGRAQSIALAVAAVAPAGFISGVLPIAAVAWAGLSVALVPLGLRLLTSNAVAAGNN